MRSDNLKGHVKIKHGISERRAVNHSVNHHVAGQKRPSVDNVDDVDNSEDDDASSGTSDLPQSPPEVVHEIFSSMIGSMPRTKEDVMGWCSSEDDDDEGDEEDQKIKDMTPLENELYNRFKILHCQYLRNGQYESK